VKLWEIPTDAFRERGNIGVLPLLALTREGGSREVVNEAIDRIEQAELSREEKENLLTFTLYLATLGFKKQGDKDWLKERFMMLKDIIRDTEIYQIILQEGREEGRTKGLEEGREKGRAEGRTEGLEQGRDALYRVVLGVVQKRFPELLEFAAGCVRTVTDLGSLQKLALDVVSADSLEQTRALFEAVKKYESH
jgi:predicted transposase YdaD